MSKISAIITVATAGTAVKGPSDLRGSVFRLHARYGNAGMVYVGNDGNDDVESGNGAELGPGDDLIVNVHWRESAGESPDSLERFHFDAANSGDIIDAIRIA